MVDAKHGLPLNYKECKIGSIIALKGKGSPETLRTPANVDGLTLSLHHLSKAVAADILFGPAAVTTDKQDDADIVDVDDAGPALFLGLRSACSSRPPRLRNQKLNLLV